MVRPQPNPGSGGDDYDRPIDKLVSPSFDGVNVRADDIGHAYVVHNDCPCSDNHDHHSFAEHKHLVDLDYHDPVVW